MALQQSIIVLLNQLQNAIEKLSDEEYCAPSAALSNATIGQHLRHIIEFYQELDKGYRTGLVNYDRRQRDHRIETDKIFAVEKLSEIKPVLSKPDRALQLEASVSLEGDLPSGFQTNYERELLYNLEHTVHHMAFIRVGIEEASNMELPKEFGIARSTIQARKLCAQ